MIGSGFDIWPTPLPPRSVFTAGRRREDLDTDQVLTFAVVYALQIVGEAATKVTAVTRGRSVQVPWAIITGMRNRLVHAYADTDNDILWATATVAAPELLGLITELLKAD